MAVPERLLQDPSLAPPLPPDAPRLRIRDLLLVGEVALALRQHPPRLPLEEIEVLDDGLDGRHHLSSRGPGADDGDDLAGQVVLMLPPRRVELRPLEVLETGPVGIPRHVEEAD